MKRFAAVLLMAASVAAAMPASLSAGNRKNDKNVAVVAHRGFWNCDEGGYSKNSIASLIQAQNNGFWGSEFDVNMTLDEQLLVFHDSSIEGRRIEQNPASAFDYYRLKNGEKIPTLDEYLTQGAKSKTMLVLELKKHSTKEIEDRAVALVIEKLRSHKLLKKNRVMFISFSMNICKEFARLAPGFTVQYLDTDYTSEQVYSEGVNGIDINYKDLMKDPSRVEQAKAKGMSVNSWTVNKTDAMEAMVDLGVDFITTDHPLEARKVIADKGVNELK